jgi:hypothetical protein
MQVLAERVAAIFASLPPPTVIPPIPVPAPMAAGIKLLSGIPPNTVQPSEWLYFGRTFVEPPVVLVSRFDIGGANPTRCDLWVQTDWNNLTTEAFRLWMGNGSATEAVTFGCYWLAVERGAWPR